MQRLLEIVVSLWAQVETIESQVGAARRQADNVEQSILARAFRGDLVSQDPNDESISILLDRICTERGEASVTERRTEQDWTEKKLLGTDRAGIV